jgi:hypothetical protein
MMRRGVAASALVAVIGLLTIAAATAAGPAFRDRETFTDEDTNFCGTGETVLIEGTVVANIWIGTTGGDPTQEVRRTLNLHITYTNPDTGDSVVERWSNMATNEIISGLESGVHTHEFSERGLKATYRLKNGGLLSRDAGSLTYRVTFDASDNVTDFEVVSIRGPHPAFEGDLFCSILVPALGLE